MYIKYFKPILDRIFAFLLIVLTSPLFILISFLIKVVMGGDVFFVQPRPGYQEKTIRIIKFRSMNNKKDAKGNLLPAFQRITPLGTFLRKSSLDELPQLFNVLKGEISFIGPRPLEMRYLPFYNAEQHRRHSVKPGITGWAQVNGRNTISWEEKFRLDLAYVDQVSFFFDCKIFFMTIWKVLNREGVNASAQETVVPFDVYSESTQTKSDKPFIE